ncbi:MAG: hypothetical protein NZ585_01605 [Chloracidobacterium sp.]|nr:hypothetical protein [Chloracidobacterium sp.]MDW8216298.1 hypothetical protein [Acidobacteriota bacterium]
MGFFDRFFGKKKEEPPRTPPPAYVPPEPPPLPTAARPQPVDVPPPVERAPEPVPQTSPPIVEQAAEPPLPVEETPSYAQTIAETVEEEPVEEVEAPELHTAAEAAEAEALEEDDFSLSGLTMEAAPAAGVVEEAAVGAVTQREASIASASAVSLTDSGVEADKTDFDIPTIQADGKAAAQPASGQELFLGENDLEGFDDAFERIIARGEDDGLDEDMAPAVTTDQTEVRTLFSEIAANYIRPVKAFIIELRAGAARKEWLEMCQPAISSLGKSALGMGMEDVSDAVHEFENLLAEARSSRDGMVSGELRERILSNYQTLTEMLPATFVIDDTTLQSEGMIVNSLLKQIPEVGKVTIDKLYRAGLITIESFLVGAKEDLAVATGLPIWLAEKIVEKFKSYQQQLESGVAQSGKAGLLDRLEQLTRDLQDAHEAYEIATAEESSNPSAAEDRRFYRQARQETQLQINVLLAELGAVALANEIQRLSFEKRVERLRRYIADARQS